MTVSYASSTWSSIGTDSGNSVSWYKDVTVAVQTGDLVVAAGMSSNGNGGSASISNASGSTATTNTWTTGLTNTGSSIPGITTGHTTVTGSGNLIVRCLVSAGTTIPMGTGIWVVPAGQWSGTPTYTWMNAHDSDGQQSITLSETSIVFYTGSDWTAKTVSNSTPTPSGGTLDANYTDPSNTQYTVYQAHWDVRSSGTAAYGPTTVGGPGPDWAGVIISVPGDASVTPSTSGPNYAGAASALGGGSGSWVNPANATGAPDASDAVWTAP